MIFLIGVGSAGLHCTLDWTFQSSDELPMVYLVVSVMHIELELEHNSTSSLKYPQLPVYLVLLMIINTLVYYTFQHLYWVFLVTFSVAITMHIGILFKLNFYDKNEITQTPKVKQLFHIFAFNFLGVATPIWVVDMLLCQWYLDTVGSRMYGMTPHILWHFVAGYSAYCTIVYLEILRMNALHKKVDVKYLLGLVPALIEDKSSTKNAKKE